MHHFHWSSKYSCLLNFVQLLGQPDAFYDAGLSSQGTILIRTLTFKDFPRNPTSMGGISNCTSFFPEADSSFFTLEIWYLHYSQRFRLLLLLNYWDSVSVFPHEWCTLRLPLPYPWKPPLSFFFVRRSSIYLWAAVLVYNGIPLAAVGSGFLGGAMREEVLLAMPLRL